MDADAFIHAVYVYAYMQYRLPCEGTMTEKQSVACLQ